MQRSTKNTALNLQRVTAENINSYLPAIAKLRIEVFREYPYLYQGKMEYEQQYLQTLAESPAAVVILALDQDEVVGASTGYPLSHDQHGLPQAFITAGYDPDGFFYCAESVLRSVYRGKGIYGDFFKYREQAARESGFHQTAFCAVIRDAADPRRPIDYLDHAPYWRKIGYEINSKIKATLTWQELEDTVESPKAMQFWLKSL